MKTCLIIAIGIFVIIFMVSWVPLCYSVNLAEATNELNQAEFNLNSAFAAVTKADNAGADVSRLLDTFYVGSNFLLEANLAFRAGDYDVASIFARECNTVVEGLVIDADKLTIDTERMRNNILLLTFVGSSIGLLLLVILGILFWKILKNRRYKQVLYKRPAVEEV